MKLLKNDKEWVAWAHPEGIFGPPERYPCYAYEIVTNWGMQESAGQYLYADDLARMSDELTKQQPQ